MPKKAKIARIGIIEEWEGVRYPMGWAFEDADVRIDITIDITGEVPTYAGYTLAELQEIIDKGS